MECLKYIHIGPSHQTTENCYTVKSHEGLTGLRDFGILSTSKGCSLNTHVIPLKRGTPNYEKEMLAFASIKLHLGKFKKSIGISLDYVS